MESKIDELESKTNGDSHDSFNEQTSEMFDNFFKTVKEEIKNENKEFNFALIKFMRIFESFSQNQKVSAFHGTTFFGRKCTKIKVQPTAVSRRTSTISSRKRQSNVGTKNLPNCPISLKRKDNMKEMVDMNVPSAKKTGRSRISNKKYFTKGKIKI